MCRRCFRHSFYHAQAATAYFLRGCFVGQRNRKHMEWLPLSDPVSATFAVGRADKGAKAVWDRVKLRRARKCLQPHCSVRSTNGCSCDEFCTDKWGKGKGSGVLMCLRCFRDPRSP